jgi:hypothetical protein
MTKLFAAAILTAVISALFVIGTTNATGAALSALVMISALIMVFVVMQLAEGAAMSAELNAEEEQLAKDLDEYNDRWPDCA